MGISSGAFFFVIALFCRVDAANYRVKLLLTPRFERNEVLVVKCGTALAGKIDSRVVRESTKNSSLEVRCTDVNDREGVLFELKHAGKGKQLPDKAGGWRGYWQGVIIDISVEEVGVSQESDCLASYFDVTKLGKSSFDYNVAIVDSNQAHGSFGIYSRQDFSGPVFAYEQKLRDGNGNDIEDNRINCFHSPHTKCCSVKKPRPSTYLVSIHVYDDFGFDGMMVCVGSNRGNCNYGVYKGGITHLTYFWRSFNISIPEDVLHIKSEEKITFKEPLIINIYGSFIESGGKTVALSFTYETVGSLSYDTYVEYLVDTDTFISDQKIILNSIRKISAPGQSHISSDEKVIKLMPEGQLAGIRGFFIELYYLDGYQPRRQVEYLRYRKLLKIPIRSFGHPYNVIRIYFRINAENKVNYFDVEDNDLIPKVHMQEESSYKGLYFQSRLNSFSTGEY